MGVQMGTIAGRKASLENQIANLANQIDDEKSRPAPCGSTLRHLKTQKRGLRRELSNLK